MSRSKKHSAAVRDSSKEIYIGFVAGVERYRSGGNLDAFIARVVEGQDALADERRAIADADATDEAAFVDVAIYWGTSLVAIVRSAIDRPSRVERFDGIDYGRIEDRDEHAALFAFRRMGPREFWDRILLIGRYAFSPATETDPDDRVDAA